MLVNPAVKRLGQASMGYRVILSQRKQKVKKIHLIKKPKPILDASIPVLRLQSSPKSGL